MKKVCRVVALASASLAVVTYCRMLVLRWRIEESNNSAYHRGRREGWYEAMRLSHGHDGGRLRADADAIWN